MGFYLVKSGILYDSFFTVPNTADFATLVKSYGKEELKDLGRTGQAGFRFRQDWEGGISGSNQGWGQGV